MNKNNRISEFSLILITQDNHTFLVVGGVKRSIEVSCHLYRDIYATILHSCVFLQVWAIIVHHWTERDLVPYTLYKYSNNGICGHAERSLASHHLQLSKL